MEEIIHSKHAGWVFAGVAVSGLIIVFIIARILGF